MLFKKIDSIPARVPGRDYIITIFCFIVSVLQKFVLCGMILWPRNVAISELQNIKPSYDYFTATLISSYSIALRFASYDHIFRIYIMEYLRVKVAHSLTH